LVENSGSREDIEPEAYRQSRVPDELRDMTELIATPPPSVRFGARVSRATESLRGDLDVVLSALQGAGIDSVVGVDLTHRDLGVPVVRTIVPGLEGLYDEHYVPGRRAKERGL